MLPRKYLFPHVIEMNYQAGRRLGVNVYLIDGGSALLVDLFAVGVLLSIARGPQQTTQIFAKISREELA